MKLVELTNVSQQRISIAQVRGLNLDPGASTKVSPETVKHPAVKRYLDAGLLVSTEGTHTKVEPTAPAPSLPVVSPAPVIPAEPSAEEKQVEPVETKDKVMDGKDLRKLYMTAPGMSEAVVDAMVDQFPTPSLLAQASKTVLTDLGIPKNLQAKLKFWAQEQ